MTLRKEIEKPQRMGGENYESDNYDAGYNQACSDWEGFIKERLEKITDGYQITKTQAKVNDLIKELE